MSERPDLLSVDLSVRPSAAAAQWVTLLRQSIGRPVTGDDIRQGIEALTAVRGELAKLANDADIAAQLAAWQAEEARAT